MPTYKGSEIARAALREIGILDPIEAGHAEQIADALAVGTDLLDSWRTSKLFISGITRNEYSLTADQQSHTIGSGGDFNQDYPESIEYWGVIPDDDAADPVEIPMGRPLSHEEWRLVRVKSQSGAYPIRMWYDARFAAGLGRCHFHPIQDHADVDVVLYCFVPAVTTLVSATSYTLQPGFAQAIKLGLAEELAGSGRYDVPMDIVQRIAVRAAKAIGRLKRSNMRPRQSPIRSEYVIGTRGRTHNLYTDG